MSGSYPRVYGPYAATADTEIILNDQAFGTVGRVVFQVLTADSFDGAIRVYRRIQGADRVVASVPWVRSAYRNETGQADVNNTTDITAANIYSVYCDATDVKLERQSGTTGTFTVIVSSVAG
jgi:hypothetical protein